MAELNGSPVTLDALQSLGLVNYGHFTSMRVDDHCIRGLSKHLDRLANDCQAIFGIGLDRSEVREYLKHAIAGRGGSFIARVTVFDPDADLGRPGMVESLVFL